MLSITFSEQTLNELIEDTKLELSYCTTELEANYYKGILNSYTSMLTMLKEQI